MITRIYHKKNQQFETEFYQDKECQKAFNFENIENLYIELKDGDCTPIFSLSNKLWSLNIKANIFTPIWYLGLYDGISSQTPLITLNDVLDDIDLTLDNDNIDLSKYISTSSAILFLSEEEANKHSDNCENWFFWFLYQKDFPVRQSRSEMDIRDWKTITIFLTHGTESELQKANEIAQELREKYGIDEVNLFVLHCFGYLYGDDYIIVGFKKENNFNTRLILDKFIDKVIATNSTGISEPQVFQERLQILDCYDIFNNYLKGE